jgi:hypothetical protein
MRRLALLFIVLITAFTNFQPARAQELPKTLSISDLGISYEFGDFITFQATLTPPSPISEAYLLFRAEGEATTRVLPLTVEADGKTNFRYDMKQAPVRPFAIIHFLYRVKLQTGEELSSEESIINYEDNRFPWQIISGDGLTVHWYAGDISFGQDAMDVARRGIQHASELLLVAAAKPIDIYIYASSTDLQKALEIGGLPFVGGHASPDLHLALVAIAPGPEQGLEMDRKIPHELAHIITYDLTQERYNRLPIWLQEGIATQVELAANPDYPRALSLASEKKTLIPLAELCGSFPQEAGRAFLAYAEAQSFTNFLIKKHGQTGLLALTKAYGDGLDCGQGAQRALGQPLSQLEADWRTSELGENAGITALTNLFPYLAILLVLLMVSLVSAFTFKKAPNSG